MTQDRRERATDDVGPHPTGVQTLPDTIKPEDGRGPRWRRIAIKLTAFATALFLFILSIQLMKKGASEIGPRISGSFPFDNGVSTLGLGWLGAYFVLSGSPVAATSLTFFSTNTITPLQTFTMLSGSRLGAAFIVLLVGFLYAMKARGQRRGESIGMGVLALALTALQYVPGMLIGYVLLKAGALSGINWTASSELNGAIDLVWGPVRGAIEAVLPAPLLFPVGLGAILVSFKLLDLVLPELDGERQADLRGHWVKKPWIMFALGCVVALVTLSVSVALTILVPLASKGYVRREESIPYIMGANIMTLADTLVVAMLLGRPEGVQIVLAQAIAVTFVTILYLVFAYRPICRGVIRLDNWVVGTNRRLVLFVVILFVLPVMMMFSGLLIGPIAPG